MATQERWTLGDSINEFQDGATWRVPVWANDSPSGDKIAAESFGSTREIAQERAKLIAAAPELLAFAQKFVAMRAAAGLPAGVTDAIAEAAIAKATA